jgi:hypothetical protein
MARLNWEQLGTTYSHGCHMLLHWGRCYPALKWKSHQGQEWAKGSWFHWIVLGTCSCCPVYPISIFRSSSPPSFRAHPGFFLLPLPADIPTTCLSPSAKLESQPQQWPRGTHIHVLQLQSCASGYDI